MRFQLFIIISLVLAIFVFMACKSKKNISEPTKEGKLISLQMTGCYGYCPVYTLTVFNSGKLLFEPQMFTFQTDTIEKKITDTQLTNLKRIVTETNLTQYPDRIESGIADAAMGILKIYDPEKSVMGSIDRPEPLLNLEHHLKELGKAHGIETMKGRNPADPHPETAKEVIVSLKEEVNAGNWIMQFGDMKLRLVKRLPSGNTWLIEYDTTQLTEAQVLEVFTTDKDVEAAQGNPMVDDRN